MKNVLVAVVIFLAPAGCGSAGNQKPNKTATLLDEKMAALLIEAHDAVAAFNKTFTFNEYPDGQLDMRQSSVAPKKDDVYANFDRISCGPFKIISNRLSLSLQKIADDNGEKFMRCVIKFMYLGAGTTYNPEMALEDVRRSH